MRKLLAAAAGVVALVVVLPTVAPEPETALELSGRTTGVTPEQFDTPALAFADFDGDGRLEIVAHNNDQHVYVYHSGEERLLARFRTKYPDGWGVRPLNEPVAKDVDGDGTPEIVTVNSAGYVCVHAFDAARSTSTKFAFAEEWCRRMDLYDGYGTGADAGPWVEDVTGDGKAEIFSQTEKRGIFAFRHDGEILWSRNKTGGNAGPLVVDLDGNGGGKEILFFGDAGEVRVLDAATGDSEWAYWASGSSGVKPGSIPVAGSAGNLDSDPELEIVFTARHAENELDYSQNHLGVFVLEHNGKLKWMRQPAWGHPMSYTHPVLADVDGDGRNEILLQDWNTIGHKPGDWEPLGPNHVFVYEADGTAKWMTEVSNTWSNDDVALADVDGDGELEVVASGRKSGVDGLWFLDAASGEPEFHAPLSGWTVLRGPHVLDLDGDGDLEIVVPVHKSDKGGAILVLSTGVACEVVYGGWHTPVCGEGPRRAPDDGGDDEDAEAERVHHRVWCALTLGTCEPWDGSFTRPE